MHIKYRLHIPVYLHTSALIVLDEWRLRACGTHESPGYPRLPQVSLKQDAVLHEGLGRHLTITDGESGAQERQKEEPSLKYWWDGCLFCCSSEVHFSDVPPRKRNGPRTPSENAGPRRQPCVRRGGGRKKMLPYWDQQQCLNQRLVTFSRAQGLRGQTSEETSGDGTGWWTERVKTVWSRYKTAAAPPLKHSALLIFV